MPPLAWTTGAKLSSSWSKCRVFANGYNINDPRPLATIETSEGNEVHSLGGLVRARKKDFGPFVGIRGLLGRCRSAHYRRRLESGIHKDRNGEPQQDAPKELRNGVGQMLREGSGMP